MSKSTRTASIEGESLRIQFCGADRTVTGSCHLIEVNGLRVLLDLGMYQGPRDESREFNGWLVDEPAKIDAVILSHGHLDHCGKLPVLTRTGFAGPIYCTPATADVARIVLEDSAKIQLEDAEYLNRRVKDADAPQVRPLYVPADVALTLKRLRTVPYGRRTEIGSGVAFTFFDAGHILGSAYVLIEWPEDGRTKTLLFTADIGRYDTPILNDPHPLPGPVDFVITESTYGGKSHGPIDAVGPQLIDALEEVVRRKSRLIIPSFAVGRTQTVLWYVAKAIEEKQIPPIPLYVDSPMGVEASEVYRKHRDAYDPETSKLIGERDLFGLSRVTFASSSQDSRKINGDRGPCVIIASSPTCEFGRVLHHVKQSIENPNDVIVFVGWIPPGTLGRRLQNNEPRVKILDRWYERRCEVRTIHGLSAHADGNELIRFLTPTLRKETTAYVVHGEPDQSEAFANRLMRQGLGLATVPAINSSLYTSVATDAPTDTAQPARTDGD
jgi:metallo-beta-lactamase family protein